MSGINLTNPIPHDVAWSKWFTRHSARCLARANQLLGRQADADEVVQTAFCRLLEKVRNDGDFHLAPGAVGATEPQAPGFESMRHNETPADSRDERLLAMLFTIVRNLCIDELRRRVRRRSVSLQAAEELPQTGAGPEAWVEAERRIDGLMNELPANWRQALELKVFGGLSYEEISGTMDCTRAQVRTWIFRARQSLRKKLEEAQ